MPRLYVYLFIFSIVVSGCGFITHEGKPVFSSRVKYGKAENTYTFSTAEPVPQLKTEEKHDESENDREMGSDD